VTRPANANQTVTAALSGASASRNIQLTVRHVAELSEPTDYLFAHFTGSEGRPTDEQIYFATSRDGALFTDTRANGNPCSRSHAIRATAACATHA